MDFTPHNSKHAVQRTVFAVFFPDTPLSKPLTKGDFKKDAKALATLPGSRPIQAINIAIDEEGARQGSMDTGLQLFLSEPDGSHAWMLQVAPNHILVECRIYTRWAYVWQLAETYLSDALAAVTGVLGQPASVARLELMVTDRFETASPTYELSTLLKPNPIVPQKMFEAGPAWHAHLGWYDEVKPRVLNNVNFDAKPVVDNQDDGPWQIEILHFQRMQLEQPYEGEAASKLQSSFLRMHNENTAFVRSILTDEMARQIGV